MPKYLAEAEIRHAVEQLRRSSAKGRMCEYLIGLRALKLANQEEVGLGESVPEFIQAIEEFTLWNPDKDGNPYFNPFGAQAAFKGPRFYSNGPSNTIADWSSQANKPFDVINTRPKSIRRRSLSATQLRKFLILTRQEGNRPRLIDAAVWFYRLTDLETQDSGTPDRAALEAKFTADLDLQVDYVRALYRLEDEDTEEDDKGDSDEFGTPSNASEAARTDSEGV